MRSLLLLCLLAVAFANEEYEYEPEPDIRRVPRSHPVREYDFDDAAEEDPLPLEEEEMEWAPSEEHCQGHCDDLPPTIERYQRVSSTNKDTPNVQQTHKPSNQANQSIKQDQITEPSIPNQQFVQNLKYVQPNRYYTNQQPVKQGQTERRSQPISNKPIHQSRPIDSENQASTLQQQIISGRNIEQPNNFAVHQPFKASNQPIYKHHFQPPYHQPINHVRSEQLNQFSNHRQPEQAYPSAKPPIYLARVNAPNHAPTYQPFPYHQASSPFVAIVHASPAQVPSPVLSPVQSAGTDQAPAAGHHHAHKHAQGHTQGAGRGAHATFHKQGGEKSTESFNKDHHVDKGGKGEKVEEVHKKEYEEATGKKKKHRDHAGHKGSHEEEAHGHRGAKFDEKKGHKKGHKTKGYHNKYHKDEFHKEHKFYDDYHKSGEHHRFGKFNAKHASNESGKKKAHHVNAGHDYVEKGKKGHSNKGHVDADHKGYNGKRGHEEHHNHQSSHGKKGGKEGGSQWGYAKKN